MMSNRYNSPEHKGRLLLEDNIGVSNKIDRKGSLCVEPVIVESERVLKDPEFLSKLNSDIIKRSAAGYEDITIETPETSNLGIKLMGNLIKKVYPSPYWCVTTDRRSLCTYIKIEWRNDAKPIKKSCYEVFLDNCMIM